jgi:hypothetical protein
MATPGLVDSLFMPVIFAGIISVPVSLVVAAALCIRRPPTGCVILLAAIILGVIAGFLGMVEGAAAACPHAGNLCGLFGVLGTGPLAFAVTVVVVAAAFAFLAG